MTKFVLPKVLVSLDEKVTKIVLDKKAAVTKARFLALKNAPHKVKFYLRSQQTFSVVNGYTGQTAKIAAGGPFEMSYLGEGRYVGEVVVTEADSLQEKTIRVSFWTSIFNDLVRSGSIVVASFS